MRPLILASSSQIRARLLRDAGLNPRIEPARIDEAALRDGLLAEGATPREVADSLAENKAMRIAGKHPEALVLGCDQVMVFQGSILSKPADTDELRERLVRLRGQEHGLLTAAVLFDQGRPVWRHLSEAKLFMRRFSASFLNWYLSEIKPEVLQTVGGYEVESLGVRLFERIEGDYFAILGLPVLEVLNALTIRGDLNA